MPWLLHDSATWWSSGFDSGCCTACWNAGVCDSDLDAFSMLPPTLPNSMDRKTATPIVPPIWRKNVAEVVATPMSRGGTADCRISSSGCMQLPSP